MMDVSKISQESLLTLDLVVTLLALSPLRWRFTGFIRGIILLSLPAYH